MRLTDHSTVRECWKILRYGTKRILDVFIRLYSLTEENIYWYKYMQGVEKKNCLPYLVVGWYTGYVNILHLSEIFHYPMSLLLVTRAALTSS